MAKVVPAGAVVVLLLLLALWAATAPIGLLNEVDLPAPSGRVEERPEIDPDVLLAESMNFGPPIEFAPGFLEQNLVLSPDQTFGALMSTKHPESDRLISNLYAEAGHSKRVEQKGDGRSNGSITLYVGIGMRGDPGAGFPEDPTRGTLIIVKRSTKYTQFLAISTRIAENLEFSPGWERIVGTPYYFDTTQLSWTAAWWMAARSHNGHGSQPNWLTVGQSETQLQLVFRHYYQVVQVASLPLP